MNNNPQKFLTGLVFLIISFFLCAQPIQAVVPNYRVETNVSEIILPLGETVELYSYLKHADTGKEVGLGATISNVAWEIDTSEIIEYKRQTGKAQQCPNQEESCLTNDIILWGYQLGTVNLNALVMIDGGTQQIKSPPIKITVVPAGQTKVVTPFTSPTSYPSLIDYGAITPTSALDTMQLLYTEYEQAESGVLKMDLYLRGRVEEPRLGNVIVVPLPGYFNQDSNNLMAAAIPPEKDPWQFLDSQYQLGFSPVTDVAELAAQPKLFNQFNRQALDRYLQHYQAQLSPFQLQLIDTYGSTQDVQFLVMIFKMDSLKPGMWTPVVKVPGQKMSANQFQFPFHWLSDEFPQEKYLVQYQVGLVTKKPFFAEGRFYRYDQQALYSLAGEVLPKDIFGFEEAGYLSEVYFKIFPQDTQYLIMQGKEPDPTSALAIKKSEQYGAVEKTAPIQVSEFSAGSFYKIRQNIQSLFMDKLYFLRIVPSLAGLLKPHQDSKSGYYLTQQPYDPLELENDLPQQVSVILRGPDGKTVVDQAELEYEWQAGAEAIVSVTGAPTVSLFEQCCAATPILPYPYVAGQVQARAAGQTFYTVTVKNTTTGEKLVTARFPITVLAKQDAL